MMLCLDPYHGQGVAYLHGASVSLADNPTGAVATPISLATTFQQSIPGVATAPDDPNSFGKGYEGHF
jgi:hypothetical protein